jgi:basic amino acid/polyamine antiporter, APA family
VAAPKSNVLFQEGRSAVPLLRQLGVTSAIALVVSNMIGTGIFTTTGFLAGDLGSAWLVLLIYGIGAVVALAGAFCYSELGINFPSSGGEYVYLTRAYGPTWGFMTGWVSFFAGFSAPIAAAALAFSDYLGIFWPALKQENAHFTLGPEAWALKFGAGQALACALIALFTIINVFGIKTASRLQNLLTAIKVGVIAALILFGFAVGTGDWSHLAEPATRTSSNPLPIQFAVSLFFVYVSYSGWNAATYVAEELKNPARTLPIALAWGTALVAILYVGLNLVFIYAVPLENLKGVIAVGSVTAQALFGSEIAGVFSILMAAALMATVNAMVTIGPRVYYAMAKNGAFFSWAARVDPRWHTPVPAILCQGAVSMLICFTPFQQLLFYIGITLNFFTVMAVASLFRLRKRPGWQRLGVVSFAWPVIPLFFLLVSAWMFVFGMTLEWKVSSMAFLTVATGALVYRLRLKARPPQAS